MTRKSNKIDKKINMILNFPFKNFPSMFPFIQKRDEGGQIGIFEFSYGRDEISRTSIINHLAHKYGARRYLEIGVRDGRNIEKIQIPKKIGVDPAGGLAVIYPVTSDEFFEGYSDQPFDIIFIDGMHLEEFVARDIENALKHLSEGGHIIVHDCNPPTEFHQRETYKVNGEFPGWNGTVWRGWIKLRATRPNLTMSVVDTDYGVGIIKRGKQTLISSSEISYQEFSRLRKTLLPLISVRRFLLNY